MKGKLFFHEVLIRQFFLEFIEYEKSLYFSLCVYKGLKVHHHFGCQIKLVHCASSNSRRRTKDIMLKSKVDLRGAGEMWDILIKPCSPILSPERRFCSGLARGKLRRRQVRAGSCLCSGDLTWLLIQLQKWQWVGRRMQR